MMLTETEGVGLNETKTQYLISESGARGPVGANIGTISIVFYGGKSDGMTDDTAALNTLISNTFSENKTLIIAGPTYISSNIIIPANIPVRLEGNGSFVGPGVVTWQPHNVFTQSIPTVSRLTGQLEIDYGYGEFVSRGSATGHIVTQDIDKGAQKISWTSATANQYASCLKSELLDLSNSDSFAVDIGYDRAEVNTYLAVYVSGDDIYESFNNYAFAFALQNGVNHLPRTTVRFKKSDLTENGTVDWSAIKHVEIRLYRGPVVTDVDTVGYVYGFYSELTSRPKVLLTFDDGVESLFSGIFPIMQSVSMRGTAYLNGGFTYNGVGSSSDDLQKMYDYGWDFGSHGWSHLRLTKSIASYSRIGTTATMVFNVDHGYSINDIVPIDGCDQDEYNGNKTVLSTPTSKTITFFTDGVESDTTARGYYYIAEDQGLVRSEIRRNKEWLLSQFWNRAANHFAYPFGGWDLSIVDILRDEFDAETARVTVASNGGSYVLDTVAGNLSPHITPGFELGSATTAVAALAKVDEAIDKQGSIIFLGHGIAESNPAATEMLTSEFQELIAGIALRRDSGNIDVVTISEWNNRL